MSIFGFFAYKVAEGPSSDTLSDLWGSEHDVGIRFYYLTGAFEHSCMFCLLKSCHGSSNFDPEEKTTCSPLCVLN